MTIGCLLDVASRVKSGPIEVTSLVRHLEYQHELRLTNANATPDVPTHALGMAFDIAMVNTPLKTVREINNVPFDLPIAVRVEADHPMGSDVGGRGLAGYFGIVGELLSSTWRMMSPWTVG